MPSISTIKQESKFKKKEYRAWNVEGDKINTENSSEINKENFLTISPEKIIKWQYKDRPDNELGNIKSLAEDMAMNGQQQPCVVREIKDNLYELIIGERRWQAAKLKNLNLDIIVRNYSDTQAALSQASENENRKDLSEYAKGISFSKLINSGILKQKDLIENLGRNKQYISALLSFDKIPLEIINAIGDMRKISARTAEEIKQLSNKGDVFIDAIISVSNKLRSGKMGQKLLKDTVHSIINNEETDKKNMKYNYKGKNYLTLKKNKNNSSTFHLSQETIKQSIEHNVELSELGDELFKIIKQKLNLEG